MPCRRRWPVRGGDRQRTAGAGSAAARRIVRAVQQRIARRPLLPGHYRSGSAAGGYYRSAGVAAQSDGVGRRRPSDCGIAGLPAADVGLFIGLVAANDIDQILHRISRGEWSRSAASEEKVLSTETPLLLLVTVNRNSPLPVVRQLAQQVINGLHRLLWNIQHHWFEKYFSCFW